MNSETMKNQLLYCPIGRFTDLKEVMFTFQMEGEVVKSVDFAPAIPQGH
jgi:hypothetical protein